MRRPTDEELRELSKTKPALAAYLRRALKREADQQKARDSKKTKS